MKWHKWGVRYIDNKLGKTQETSLTLNILIPGATNLTTFVKVSSSMYAALFGIRPNPSGNMYLVTKLVPLRLECTRLTFSRNVTRPFTSANSQYKRLLLKNLGNYNVFMVGFFFDPNNIYLILIENVGGFIKIKLKVMIKTSKNIMRWVCTSQIIPLHINHNVPMVLLLHTNMWSFCSICLIFNQPPCLFRFCSHSSWIRKP